MKPVTVKTIAETSGGDLDIPVLFDIGDMWLSCEAEYVKISDGRRFVVLRPITRPAPWEIREWLDAKSKEIE